MKRKLIPESLLIPAVAYFRMSSDDQAASIEQQRKAVHEYAARNGYRIIREYVDKGKSGSKEPEKRVQFQQMLVDSNGRDFVCVLTWDAHRFGRMDNLDIGYAKKILRDNGIYLDTVKEGKIDWNTIEGRWKDMSLAEAGKGYSISLGADTLRGRQDALESGSWPHGEIPYGYDKCFIDQQGAHHVVKRHERFRKPPHWRLVLCINEDEAKIVRLIFEDFASFRDSVRGIARRLNTMAVRGPGETDKGWNKQSVDRILRNPAYDGLAVLGGRPLKPSKKAFHRATGASKTGIVPAILEPGVSAKVRARLETLKSHRVRKEAASDAPPLLGVLYCANCGLALSRRCRRRGKPSPTRYTCSSKSQGRPGDCHCWGVYESELLPFVRAEVVRLVDGEVLKALQARRTDGMSEVEVLVAHVASLRKRVIAASKRYLEAPDDIQADLETALREIKDQLATAEEALKTRQYIEAAGSMGGFLKWWHRLREELGAEGPPPYDVVFTDPPYGSDCFFEKDEEADGLPTDPAALRGVFRQLGVKVMCYWVKSGKAKGLNSPEWVLDRARVKVSVAWQGSSSGPANQYARP